MRPLWEPFISWSDCEVLTRKMGEVQLHICKALNSGKQESGVLNNHDFLTTGLIDLQEYITKIRAKQKK